MTTSVSAKPVNLETEQAVNAELMDSTYRQHKRLSVDLFMNKFIGDEPFACRTKDLSQTGVYLRKLIEPSRADSDLVGLEFTLPGSQEVIWASGEIVRQAETTSEDGVAIRFVSMAERHRKMLNDFIDNADGWVISRRLAA